MFAPAGACKLEAGHITEQKHQYSASMFVRRAIPALSKRAIVRPAVQRSFALSARRCTSREPPRPPHTMAKSANS